MALAQETRPESIKPSLDLYVSETAPSPSEKRAWLKWLLLALVAALLHVVAFWLVPRFFPPVKSAPVEVTQIDAKKLAAIKNRWKERGFLLAKDANRPKDKTPEPKNARYESDRNRSVERETRAKNTNVVPVPQGDPNASDKETKAAQKKSAQSAARKQTARPAQKIPLSNLSNFQSLPVAAKNEEEHEAQARARRGAANAMDQETGDRNLPVGAENMLNTAESVYYTFYSRIYEQIGPIWQSGVRSVLLRKRPRPGDYLTSADIIFDADGNFIEARITTGSGDSDIDRVVPTSWAKIPRFPNPPRGLVQSDGKIHMGWTFNVRMSQDAGWQAAPPVREY
ncbi:MAG: hypothetical protein H7301_02565 [Cryobacterium sp.]|nr:hypothetical protein [Oligoflexia bacterium]